MSAVDGGWGQVVLELIQCNADIQGKDRTQVNTIQYLCVSFMVKFPFNSLESILFHCMVLFTRTRRFTLLPRVDIPRW